VAVTNPSGLNGYLGTVNVNTQSGYLSTLSPVNGFANATLSLDSDGNQYVFLPSSTWTLQAQATTVSSQWATSNFISITVTAGDF
jgi:hypothetical protein